MNDREKKTTRVVNGEKIKRAAKMYISSLFSSKEHLTLLNPI